MHGFGHQHVAHKYLLKLILYTVKYLGVAKSSFSATLVLFILYASSATSYKWFPLFSTVAADDGKEFGSLANGLGHK